MKLKLFICVALVAVLSSSAAGWAQEFSLSWHTIDSGGITFATGGAYELGGTAGQPDASTMSGGVYELAGGFWPGATGPTVCRGDFNCDGVIDFNDINPFILALSNWAAWRQRYPDCPERNADVNGDGLYGGPNGFGDINPFIKLLNQSGGNPIPCP